MQLFFLSVRKFITRQGLWRVSLLGGSFMEQNLKFFSWTNPHRRETMTLHSVWKLKNHCREESISLSSVWKHFERQSLHQKAHTEEKPYHCQVCAKCFTKSLHEKTNTGKNPFCCQVCWNSLRDNLYIKKHTQKRNHIIVKSVQSVSQKVCMKKPKPKNQLRNRKESTLERRHLPALHVTKHFIKVEPWGNKVTQYTIRKSIDIADRTLEKKHNCRKFYTDFISFFVESINFSLLFVYLRYTKSCIIHSICESTSKILLI